MSRLNRSRKGSEGSRVESLIEFVLFRSHEQLGSNEREDHLCPFLRRKLADFRSRLLQVICEILSATVLENFIRTINPQWINLPNLWTAHSHIWADTGDQLSRFVAALFLSSRLPRTISKLEADLSLASFSQSLRWNWSSQH